MNLDRNRDPRVTRPMRRLTSNQIALIAAGLLILGFAVWIAVGMRRGNPDALLDNRTAAAADGNPAQTCAAQSTYDLIKRELFRRAAALRGSDQASFDKIAAYAVVRIDRPLLASEDQGTGAVGCTGSLTLDLPPGVAVVGGRRALTGEIGYTLQRSADGNGEVLTLTRADAIITPLATLARVGQSASDPLAPEAADSLAPESSPLVPLAEPDMRPSPPTEGSLLEARPAPPPIRANTSPSFNCANARTRGEVAVCRDSGLAVLDRQMAATYVDALRDADPATRATLRRSRDRFLSYRDQCPSNDCIADTYRGRIREIRDISSGRLR